MFGSGKKQQREASAAWWTKQADDAAKDASAEAKKVEGYRQSLKSGKSDDPAADRYMIRQHDSARRIAEANAKDYRDTAKNTRKWF
jgi:hypothetical protein